MRAIVAIVLGIILIDAGLLGNLGSMIAAVVNPASLKKLS